MKGRRERERRAGRREEGDSKCSNHIAVVVFFSLQVVTACLSVSCLRTTHSLSSVSVHSSHTHSIYAIHVRCTVHKLTKIELCVDLLPLCLSCGLEGLLRLHRACCVVGNININTNMFPRRLPPSLCRKDVGVNSQTKDTIRHDQQDGGLQHPLLIPRSLHFIHQLLQPVQEKRQREKKICRNQDDKNIQNGKPPTVVNKTPGSANFTTCSQSTSSSASSADVSWL